MVISNLHGFFLLINQSEYKYRNINIIKIICRNTEINNFYKNLDNLHYIPNNISHGQRTTGNILINFESFEDSNIIQM